MREVDLPMPKLSMTMTEGQLSEWRKQEGEQVRAGEVVCEVLSDKVDMEVESPVDGTLVRHQAAPGEVVAVGAPLAVIATEADDLVGDLLAPQPEVEAEPADSQARPAAPAPTPARGGPKPAVPAARRRAAELGVDLDAVAGSGPDGLVLVADVERAGESERPPQAAPAPSAPPPPAAVGGQLAVFVDVDLEALGARRGALGWTALVVLAAARALREHPRINAAGDGRVAVAVATDAPDGLLAPVLADPDRLPPDRLDRQLRRLADRARQGRLSEEELAGATFTVSNLGAFGVAEFQAAVTPPQAAALSVGAVAPRPVVRDGTAVARAVVVRLGCRLGLAVDQRAADGADAARFLAEVRDLLEDPDRLLTPDG
jgi:pyruvate dehydrogenase E2 component (dihydrolipoamide acetyltransferase)